MWGMGKSLVPPRHSRESGNPEPPNQDSHPKSTLNLNQQIPSPLDGERARERAPAPLGAVSRGLSAIPSIPLQALAGRTTRGLGILILAGKRIRRPTRSLTGLCPGSRRGICLLRRDKCGRCFNVGAFGRGPGAADPSTRAFAQQLGQSFDEDQGGLIGIVDFGGRFLKGKRADVSVYKAVSVSREL